jgi:hypothetical protein
MPTDNYDSMTLDELHTEACERILSAHPTNDARCNLSRNAFMVIAELGDGVLGRKGLYKSGCTLTAYPHDNCYSCEFYKVKFAPNIPDSIAGESDNGYSRDGDTPCLEAAIFRAALRALDWAEAQSR